MDRPQRNFFFFPTTNLEALNEKTAELLEDNWQISHVDANFVMFVFVDHVAEKAFEKAERDEMQRDLASQFGGLLGGGAPGFDNDEPNILGGPGFNG